MSARSLGVRVAWTVASLLAFLTVLHAVFYLMPGDPVRALFGLRSPGPALLQELRGAFHLDDPYPQQLWRYLSGLVTGDLGPVYRLSPNGLSPSGGSVGTLIGAAMPNTLRLVGLAVLIQAVVGTALTVVLSGVGRRRMLAMKAVTSLLIAVPAFALAGVLASYAPGVVRAANLLAGAACLAAVPAGMVALVGHPLVRDTRRSNFVLRATASGLHPARIRWVHTLRPTLGTMLTVAAAETGNLLTAALLVEPIIGRHGIGAVLTDAIQTRQGPTILAVVGVSFVLVAVLNLLVDVASALLDPRVQAI